MTVSLNNRLSPQFPDGERVVLCSMIDKGGALVAEMATLLSPADFYVPAHRIIFDMLAAMRRAEIHIDRFALIHHLESQGVLEDVGGKEFIFGLFADSWTHYNTHHYAKIIANKRAQRDVIAMSEEFIALAFEAGDESAPLLDKVSSRVSAIAASAIPRGLPEIVDALDAKTLYGQAIPPEVISGTLHRGGKMMIGGGSKSFKTWLLMDLGLSVAAGSPWLGIQTTKGRVLFINLEIQPFAFAIRQNEITAAKGIELARGQMDTWNLRGHCANLTKLAVQIIQRAKDSGYSLIIIDPIYKVLGGRDENAAGDIGNLLNEIERLSVETGAAVAFGHHYAKGNASGKESIDRVSGSGAFARDPDAILTVTAHEEEGAYTVESIVRNFPPSPAFTVRWNHPLMVRDANLDPARLKKPKTGRESIYSVQDILDAIGLEEMDTKTLKAAVCEETGMKHDSFHRYLRAADAQKKVKQTASGKWSKI